MSSNLHNGIDLAHKSMFEDSVGKEWYSLTPD
jgi:hypothetical protein